jgi:simple sugar transport system permease protein
MIDVALLNSTFRLIAPILLAALGGLMCERVRIFNIALEGTLILGAFTAVAASYYTESALIGVVAAALAGVLFNLILGLFVVKLRSDSIVTGIALNLLAAGLTIFLLRQFFGVKGTFDDPAIVGLGSVELPVISQIPVLGEILSGHSWIVYFSWVMVVIVYIILFKQVFGLRMRGVGLNDTAAQTLGVNVSGIRYAVLVFCGVLAGMGGAQLSLGQVSLFVENMSAGRGWIAVVAVMLGRAHPVGVFAACLLFGFADALSFRLQGMMMPHQIADTIPYLVTLIALFIAQITRSRRSRPKEVASS